MQFWQICQYFFPKSIKNSFIIGKLINSQKKNKEEILSQNEPLDK